MKLTIPNANQTPKEPDITSEHLAILKSYIKAKAIEAGDAGVDVIDLMTARREDKSGELYWQQFTDVMWINTSKELESEWAAEMAAENIIQGV